MLFCISPPRLRAVLANGLPEIKAGTPPFVIVHFGKQKLPEFS